MTILPTKEQAIPMFIMVVLGTFIINKISALKSLVG